MKITTEDSVYELKWNGKEIRLEKKEDLHPGGHPKYKKGSIFTGDRVSNMKIGHQLVLANGVEVVFQTEVIISISAT
jgi:hypothetical protein